MPGDTETVAGLLYPRAGRRSRWEIIVPKCSCGYMHRHVADYFDTTFVRSPSCRPSATYVVHAYLVLPEPTS